jgi:hypothetical protein
MKKKRKKVRGKVEKVSKALVPNQPEKAQIVLPEADDLYQEIRVVNEVMDEDGSKAALKPRAEVDVILEADSDATIRKPAQFMLQV